MAQMTGTDTMLLELRVATPMVGQEVQIYIIYTFTTMIKLLIILEYGIKIKQLIH